MSPDLLRFPSGKIIERLIGSRLCLFIVLTGPPANSSSMISSRFRSNESSDGIAAVREQYLRRGLLEITQWNRRRSVIDLISPM
eukprot:2867179-Pyramimonas_sp.AAC.1